MKTALVLAPHTDDGELGCGATLARLVGEGWHIKYVSFSIGATSEGEMYLATNLLGITDIESYIFQTRLFHVHRQEILDYLIRVRDDMKPDLVFIPCSGDVHQDHQIIHQEAKRAFKHCSLLGYELPWNHKDFSADMFYKVSVEDLGRKMDALDCYESQRDRPYFDKEFTKGLARVRGLQVSTEYAEAFEVIRWIQ